MTNFRMPAEWESHEGTWIAWPHNESHWPGKFEPIPAVFAEIVRALVAAGEKVFILVNDGNAERRARNVMDGLPSDGDIELFQHIKFFRFQTNTSWARDFGPIFVKKIGAQAVDAGLVATNWIFNTWGGKYPPWDKDNAIPSHIAAELKMEIVSPGIVLEGGSIDVNGEGDLLTTEQCLLNKNRNPELNPAEIEEHLRKFLGAENIIWLKEGIVGDDTDGHIDDIARFTDANTIACAYEENEKDENYEILKQVYKDLLQAKNSAGKPFRIVKVPMPDPVIHDGQRLPASYLNFYIANKAVLMPVFGATGDTNEYAKSAENKKDGEAEKILQNLFPARKIIPINCRDLVWGLGTIHCSTQQQPQLDQNCEC